jgi:hypothetical protein
MNVEARKISRRAPLGLFRGQSILRFIEQRDRRPLRSAIENVSTRCWMAAFIAFRLERVGV